ncbi:hypothetical protein ACFVUS_06970 [Nocardia sp. NPDC058058]|uniref:hypothetical protein n=1 Tax=Nocardia sp. NPDC058058 TaxID=3346317 RepID=UPI0036DB4D8F
MAERKMTHPQSTPSEPRRWGTPRKHAGEGIEDGYNVLGLILLGLAVVALGSALVAAGYGFAGWALVAGIICVVLAIAGGTVIYAEWRRLRNRPTVDPEARQGH